MNELMSWDPFRELDSMHDRINRFFDASLRPFQAMTSDIGATDIYEQDGKLGIEVALPRFTKDEVDINLTGGRLEIKAEHNEENKDDNRNYIRRESTSAQFYRAITLPKGVDIDGAKADFTEGVLRITMPMKELPQPKKLEIGAGEGKTK